MLCMEMKKVSDIKDNLSDILHNIRVAEKKAGRNENSVKLVAVSKFHSADDVIEAVRCGQNLFGENRIQEAAAKFDEIRAKGYRPQLHIVGTLQRNKVREAVRIAECIESVDRIPLLEEIEKQCARQKKNISVFLELHTGEDSKAGFPDAQSLEHAVRMFCEDAFPHVVPAGLMTMAPAVADISLIRNSFSSLRALLLELNRKYPSLPLKELSMGMSGDYEIAIEEGATIVRIGTALFGARAYAEQK